jgi:hypothetical protein
MGFDLAFSVLAFMHLPLTSLPRLSKNIIFEPFKL